MNIVVQWTIGDVSARGFEALALSIFGSRAVFGPDAEYVVCVNTISVAAAKRRVGAAAQHVDWHDSSRDLPAWLWRYLDSNMADGAAWKFAPIRLFPNRPTLSLDNDVILWRLPDSVRRWIDDGDSLLIAEDVKACYGQFASLCPAAPRNSGIRGLPPRHDFETRIRALLARVDVRLSSETDEQGLQVALVSTEKHRVVTAREVPVCGYFRPHLLEFGSCGAHFVGLNAKHLPWKWQDRSGEQYAHEFWDARKGELCERINPPERDGSFRYSP